MTQTFEELVLPHYDMLFKMAVKLCYGDKHQAEDMVQETMLKAMVNFHKYNNTYKVSTWVGTILQNTIAEHYRVRRSQMSYDKWFERYKQNLIDSCQPVKYPDQKPILERLAEIIKALPADDQNIVDMVLAGKSHEEISKLYKVTRGRISQRLTQINKVVYDQLKADGYEIC